MPSPETHLLPPKVSSGFVVNLGTDDYIYITGYYWKPKTYTIDNPPDGIQNGTSVALRVKSGDFNIIVFPKERVDLDSDGFRSTTIEIYPCVELSLSSYQDS